MVSKVTYELNLSKELRDVPREKREDVKEEIGKYLVEQILQDVSKTKSPVYGTSFKGLSTEYKNKKKKLSSSAIANLELHGDMLNALEYKTTRDKIEVGIFDYDQAQKADNHCKFSGKSKKKKSNGEYVVPERKFIPNRKEGDEFRPLIIREINKIIEESRDG